MNYSDMTVSFLLPQVKAVSIDWKLGWNIETDDNTPFFHEESGAGGTALTPAERGMTCCSLVGVVVPYVAGSWESPSWAGEWENTTGLQHSLRQTISHWPHQDCSSDMGLNLLKETYILLFYKTQFCIDKFT